MGRTPREIETELLVLGAQAGDEGAMRALVERFEGRFLGYAARCAGSRELGAEAAQDAWAQIARGIGRLEDPAAFRAWAYRVITRRCADRVRRAQRARRDAAYEAPARDAPDGETVDGLRAAIAALPVEQALAVRLYYGEGFGVKAVGAILGVPTNTVKSRLASARARLARALGPEHARAHARKGDSDE